MSKILRVFFSLLIVFSLIISCYSVYATDIDMNLTPDTSASEQNADTNIINDTNQIDNTGMQTPTDNNAATLNPSSVGSVQEEGLGISSILSIFLITIGVILILLAIAIIIRLK